MIFEQIKSPTAAWMERSHPILREALAWILALPANPPTGITELRGLAMFVNVHDYNTLPASQCRWESHRHTIDLQFCISGGEVIEWLPAGELQPMNDYNDAKDAEHWHPALARPTEVVMAPDSFVLFLPGELHRPKVHDGRNAGVRKLVVKIRARLLDL